MSRRIACFLALLLACGAASHLRAQDQSDPLTEDEIQQIRDNAIHPDDRIRLYMKFIAERLDAVRQVASKRASASEKAQVHDKLDEFTRLCDELQDNLDTYDSAHADIRKSLKDLVPASAKWPQIVGGLPADPTYEFAQKVALEAAQSAADQAKHLSVEQDVFFDVNKKARHGNGTGPS
jgi:type VI protein secretion system component VasK